MKELYVTHTEYNYMKCDFRQRNQNFNGTELIFSVHVPTCWF